MDRAVRDEADVQAPQPQAGQQARVPRSDEDARRTGHPFAPAQEGAGSPHCVGGQQVAAPHQGSGERLPRAARIRHTREIRGLLERGKRKRTKHLEVFLAPSPESFSRLGLIVPKHGRGTVDRNRIKRRLREIGRRAILPALTDQGLALDVLVRARREAYAATVEALEGEIRSAVEALCSDDS